MQPESDHECEGCHAARAWSRKTPYGDACGEVPRGSNHEQTILGGWYPLLPQIIEPDLLFHELLAAGDVLRDIAEQQIHERAAIFLWTHQRWLTRDVYHLRGIGHNGLEVSDIVDQFHGLSLFAGPDLAVGNGLHVVVLQAATVGNCLYELPKHVIDQ